MLKKLWTCLFCSLVFFSEFNVVNTDDTTSADNTSEESSPNTKESTLADPTTENPSVTTQNSNSDNPETPLVTTDNGSSTSNTDESTLSDSSTNSDSASSTENPSVTTQNSSSDEVTTPVTTDSESSSSNTNESTVSDSSTNSDSASSTENASVTTQNSSSDEVTTPSVTTDVESSSSNTETSSQFSDTSVTTEPTTTTIRHIKEKTSFTWRSQNNENSIVFVVDDGYFISVTVSNVDMTDGNYVLIEGGDSHSDDSTDGRVFANTVKGPLSYLFQTSKVYGFHSTNENYENDKFTVVFEQTGEPKTTTTTISTTEISLPTIKPEDDLYITVNVSGKSFTDFKNKTIQEAFQECVAVIANNYCQMENIELTQTVTKSYVMIKEITQCPYNWPQSYICVRITFKLPIFYSGSNNDYKLSSEELKVMWLRWEQLDEGCFADKLDLTVYDEPDFETSIVWWAVGISIVTVCFIILLWFLKTFSGKVKKVIQRNRKDSDTEGFVDRDSISSLAPHYLQDTPKFFDG